MSSSEYHDGRPLHRLVVDAPEPGLGVLVVDAEGGIVGRCADDQSRLELDLPRGLYTVRSTRSGSFAETVVRLDDAKTVKARMPAVFSAATIPGAETTHEYYTYPAWEVSHKQTAPDQAWNGAIEAGLLLFARAPNRDAYAGEDQFVGLSLRTPDGRTLSNFDADVKRDNDVGWSAYSSRLSHGLLILEDRGGRPRQVPVPLMRGWQTQLFVMHRRRLLWEDMRLTMVAEHELASRRHRSPFDGNAEDVRAALDMDAGLLALQNDTPSVARQLVDSFLNSKFQNPILGLLGAYLMLLHYCRERQENNLQVKPDPSLIRTVLDNLHALMPASADVVALRLLAKDWVEPSNLDPIERVPLFRCGAEVLLRAAVTDPALLPEGSLLDAVSDNLYGDTVWTTWEPIALPVGTRIAAHFEPGATEIVTTDASTAMAAEPSWVELAVVDAIAAAERSDEDFAVDDLVRRIGVSPHTVRAAMNTLMARAAAQQLPTQAEWRDLRLLGGDVTRELARKLGAQFDQSLRSRIAISGLAKEQAQKPSKQQVYFRLKKTLSELAGPDTGKISADTVLTEIIKPDDKSGRLFASRRLSRHFRDFNVTLSAEELGSAETVRDVAKMMARKLSE